MGNIPWGNFCYSTHVCTEKSFQYIICGLLKFQNYGSDENVSEGKIKCRYLNAPGHLSPILLIVPYCLISVPSGDFAVLLTSGVSVRRALMYNIFSSVLSILGVIVGVILGDLSEASSWIYAATAGTFIYIALADLVSQTLWWVKPLVNARYSSVLSVHLKIKKTNSWWSAISRQ